MGAVIKAADGETFEHGSRPTGTGTRTSGESTSSESTRTETRATGDRGRTTGTGTGTGAEKEKVVSGLANVTEEEQKKAERNARRRARYAEKKAAEGKTVKPKKVNTTKQKVPEVGNSEQIKAVLGTVSTIVASRPNMAHWQLTPQELDSIATPLSNILAKSEALASLGEHSDAIALATACVTVIAPRAIITMTQIKNQKGAKKNGVGTVKRDPKPEPKQVESGENSSGNGNHVTGNAATSSNVGQSEYWIGDSLS